MNMTSDSENSKPDVIVNETDDEITYTIDDEDTSGANEEPSTVDEDNDDKKEQKQIPLGRMRTMLPESYEIYITPEELELRKEYIRKKMELVEDMRRKFKEISGEVEEDG